MTISHSLAASELRGRVTDILRAAGVSANDATMVAEDLVLADLQGVHSHGVTRVGEYLEAVADGRIDVNGACTVVRETPASAFVDGGRGFGQCVGRYALEVAAVKAAANGVCAVVAGNSHHIGRVGALAELGARRGLLVLAFVAVGIPGPVAPLGASEGRLGTNPIAYGVPASSGAVVADFATSAMPEGAVNLARTLGNVVPAGVLIDASGAATTDPNSLYGDEPGAILPFGGAWAHRGYALNLMVELFAGTLAGYGPGDEARPSNCLFLLAVDPTAFLGDERYPDVAAQTVAFVKSARATPGRVVQVPGEPEAAAMIASGGLVTIAHATAETLDRLAAKVGISDRLIR